LGRYNFNRDWVPNEDFPGLKVTYRTVHGSKGLEADYVVLVILEFGRHGFPSEIEDDPILNLAMSELETYVQGYLQRDVLQESSGGSEQRSGPLLCGVSREENTES
jgi:superfamily I DNA/RNA helicase